MTTIEEYLARLRAELAGADPAIVQDAVYDAEEYLRSEVADETDADAFASAVERYGAPDEVAAAYRDAERVSAPKLARPGRPDRGPLARFFGVLADPAAYGSLFYLLLSLATGIAYFTVVVTGVSLSLGLAVLIVGVPFMLLFLAVVRAISLVEGRMVEALLGVRMPRRPHRMAPTGGIVERIKGWLTDARTWTTMLYMLLQLPLGITYFSVVVTLLATSVGLVVQPVLGLFLDVPIAVNGDYSYYLQPWAIPLVMVGGVVLFVATMHLARLAGRGHAAYAKAVLVGRTEGTDTAARAA